MRAGAFGARLTGAGFGGCVVGVTAQQGVAGVSARARRAYEAETGISPMAYTCHAAAGAAMVPKLVSKSNETIGSRDRLCGFQACRLVREGIEESVELVEVAAVVEQIV